MNTPESENKAVKHSTEPWSVKDSHNSFTPFALWGRFSFEPIGYIHCKSNAARIVACVNFCAGTPVGDIELLKSVGVTSLQKLIADFNKAMDELGAAKVESAKLKQYIRQASCRDVPLWIRLNMDSVK